MLTNHASPDTDDDDVESLLRAADRVENLNTTEYEEVSQSDDEEDEDEGDADDDDIDLGLEDDEDEEEDGKGEEDDEYEEEDYPYAEEGQENDDAENEDETVAEAEAGDAVPEAETVGGESTSSSHQTRPMLFETGEIAPLANGSVLSRWGDSCVLATAVSTPPSGEPQDFIKLSVEYREMASGRGHLPKTFLRREGAPSAAQIATSRAVDRCLRPLFPRGYLDNCQIMLTAMSIDEDYPVDVLAINAASAALLSSTIPWPGLQFSLFILSAYLPLCTY
jgi:hypothetical protein